MMRQRHFIDSHKGATPFAVLGLMAAYRAWDNPVAWIYLAEHGVYGLLWVLKSYSFGDKRWNEPTTPAYAALIWFGLTFYFIAPWLVMARPVAVPPWYLGLSVALYSLGLFFHFASDMQKFMHLQRSPGMLLQDGLWKYCRNPNYFGELLIYVGFGMLACHWIPMAVLAAMMLFEWIPNMRRKDRSLARYPEFGAWKARSGLLFPHLPLG